MKKLLINILTMCMIFPLTACSDNNVATIQQSASTNTENSKNMQQGSETDTPVEKRTNITLTIGDTVLTGYLNDSTTAKNLISRLPVTVKLSDSGHDYCGDINPVLTYDKKDVQYGWHDGELAFWTAGNDFVIFHDDEEKSSDTGDLVIMGAVTSDIKEVRALPRSFEVTVALAK
jgi:hypothetical protein